MIESVDEVIRVARDEGIDADIVKGGVLRVARSQPQLQRLHSYVERAARWNSPYEMLSASDAAARINIAGTVGAAYSANGAKLQPAKLVRGLAGVVTKSGVTIYEATPVSSIRPHEVATPFGVVSADYVVRATEGFTSELPGLGRRWLPMNSSMIVTAPLADATWDQIGWRGFETLGDSAHTFMYAQRTADNCIAIGGRGVPYRYGSRTDSNGATASVTVRGSFERSSATSFRCCATWQIDHAWSGVLASPTGLVCFGESRSLQRAWALRVGTSGHGVTATNLAGRTMRDLILGREHRSRRACRGSTGRVARGNPSRSAGSVCARCTCLTGQRSRRGKERVVHVAHRSTCRHHFRSVGTVAAAIALIRLRARRCPRPP